MSGTQRYQSLDGLRGAASLVVVGYHISLVFPVAGWGGHQAVLVFFVLSGFVLTLPLMKQQTRWLAYYVRRLVRLYLPVWASLALALVLALLVTRQGAVGTAWLVSHRVPGPSILYYDIPLVAGTTNLNSPLWSLRWEIWFSVLLPIMWWVLRRVQRAWILALVALCVVSALAPAVKLPQSWLSEGLMEYMPVFGLGMVLALQVDRVRSWNPNRAMWVALGVAAAILAAAPYYLPGVAGDAAGLAGILVIFYLALACPGVQGFLGLRSLRWLGSRSFSLYLVHEPIVVALAIAFGHWWALLALPISLLTAEVFWRYVEQPSHRLARSLSGRVGRQAASQSNREPTHLQVESSTAAGAAMTSSVSSAASGDLGEANESSTR